MPSVPFDGIELPCARDALQLMRAALAELEAGAGDEILHRAGHQHLARVRRARDARPDVDGDVRQLAAERFAGSSQNTSMFEIHPGTSTRSRGPSPTT